MPIATAYQQYINNEITAQDFIQVIEKQLKEQADVNIFDTQIEASPYSSHSLFYVLYSDDNLSPWLIEQCINGYKDAQGNNLLFYIFKEKNISKESFLYKLKWKHSAKLDELFRAINNDGQTTLFYAFQHEDEKFLEYLEKNHPDILNQLLPIETKQGETLFHAAAAGGHINNWMYLKEHFKEQANTLINTRDKSGKKPLAHAFNQQKFYFMGQILQATYEQYQKNEITAEQFIDAIEEQLALETLQLDLDVFSSGFYLDEKYTFLFKELIKDQNFFSWLIKKCIEGYTDRNGQNLLFYALQCGDTTLPVYLKEHHPQVLKESLATETKQGENSFHAAARGGNMLNWQLVQTYLEDKAKSLIDKPNLAGEKPIITAARHQHWGIIRTLRSRACVQLDTELPSLFLQAIGENDISGVEEWIEWRANVNQVGEYKKNYYENSLLIYPLELALECASSQENYNAAIIRLLINKGAQYDDIYSLIRQPLICAFKSANIKNINILLYLVKNKAKVIESVLLDESFLEENRYESKYSLPRWLLNPKSTEEQKLSVDIFQTLLATILSSTKDETEDDYGFDSRSGKLIRDFILKKDRMYLFKAAHQSNSWHIMNLLWDAEYNKEDILGSVAQEFIKSEDPASLITTLSQAGLWPKLLSATDENGRNLLHWIGIKSSYNSINACNVYKYFVQNNFFNFTSEVTLFPSIDTIGNTPLVYLVERCESSTLDDIVHFLDQKDIPLHQALTYSNCVDISRLETKKFFLDHCKETYTSLLTKTAVFMRIKELTSSDDGFDSHHFPEGKLEVIVGLLYDPHAHIYDLQRKQLIATFVFYFTQVTSNPQKLHNSKYIEDTGMVLELITKLIIQFLSNPLNLNLINKQQQETVITGFTSALEKILAGFANCSFPEKSLKATTKSIIDLLSHPLNFVNIITEEQQEKLIAAFIACINKIPTIQHAQNWEPEKIIKSIAQSIIDLCSYPITLISDQQQEQFITAFISFINSILVVEHVQHLDLNKILKSIEESITNLSAYSLISDQQQEQLITAFISFTGNILTNENAPTAQIEQALLSTADLLCNIDIKQKDALATTFIALVDRVPKIEPIAAEERATTTTKQSTPKEKPEKEPKNTEQSAPKTEPAKDSKAKKQSPPFALKVEEKYAQIILRVLTEYTELSQADRAKLITKLSGSIIPPLKFLAAQKFAAMADHLNTTKELKEYIGNSGIQPIIVTQQEILAPSYRGNLTRLFANCKSTPEDGTKQTKSEQETDKTIKTTFGASAATSPPSLR